MSCPYENSCNSSEEVCPTLGFQDVTVGVPVEIKPFAQIGNINTECMGEPMIKRGTVSCDGKPGQTCQFTISQRIRVEVPVVFGAKTRVGEASINCMNCSDLPQGSPKKMYISEESGERTFESIL